MMTMEMTMKGEEDPRGPPACDVCGKPVLPGTPHYGLAWNSIKNLSRHWDCHTPIEVSFKDLREQLGRLEELGRDLQDRISRRERDEG